MRPQIVEEVVECGREVVPQACKHVWLTRMRVEAAVVAVEHARPKPCHVYLRDALELLGKRRVGVLDVG